MLLFLSAKSWWIKKPAVAPCWTEHASDYSVSWSGVSLGSPEGLTLPSAHQLSVPGLRQWNQHFLSHKLNILNKNFTENQLNVKALVSGRHAGTHLSRVAGQCCSCLHIDRSRRIFCNLLLEKLASYLLMLVTSILGVYCVVSSVRVGEHWSWQSGPH